MSEPTLASHLIQRMVADPRLAYYIGPYTRSFELLTEQYAKEQGYELEAYREKLSTGLRTERPKCPGCDVSKD